MPQYHKPKSNQTYPRHFVSSVQAIEKTVENVLVAFLKRKGNRIDTANAFLLFYYRLLL